MTNNGEVRLCKYGHEKTPYGTQGKWKCFTCHRERARTPEYRDKRREYVSSPNFKARQRERTRERWATDPEFRAYRKAHVVKRKKLMEGADAEVFTYEDIFNRDYWECCACGQECNPDAVYPEPDFATLDHIIPLSRGGSHTRENAQTLCAPCNFAKHNRTMAEWLEWLIANGDTARVEWIESVAAIV